MEGGGDAANVLEYEDITPKGSKVTRLEVTKSTDEPFIGPFMEVSVRASRAGDELTVKSYGSLEDLEAGENLVSEDEYFRDPAPNASGADEASDTTAEPVSGTLQVGKEESVLLYVGEDSGDYAAWCFENDSEVGKRILEICEDGQEIEMTGTIDHDSGCTVPGLEANLSASGRILSVETVGFTGG